MLGTKSIYGIMALTEMGACFANESVTVKALAQRLSLPDSYLENIFVSMKNTGWVKGVRGPGGGYRLTRDVLKFSILDIVTVLEGSLGFEAQIPEGIQVQLGYECFEKALLIPLKQQITQFMEATTLEQLVDKRVQMAQSEPMYYI